MCLYVSALTSNDEDNLVALMLMECLLLLVNMYLLLFGIASLIVGTLLWYNLLGSVYPGFSMAVGVVLSQQFALLLQP